MSNYRKQKRKNGEEKDIEDEVEDINTINNINEIEGESNCCEKFINKKHKRSESQVQETNKSTRRVNKKKDLNKAIEDINALIEKEIYTQKNKSKKKKEIYIINKSKSSKVEEDLDEFCVDEIEMNDISENINNIPIKKPDKFHKYKASDFSRSKYKPLSLLPPDILSLRRIKEMDTGTSNIMGSNKFIYSRGKPNEFIKRALESLKSEDEMFVLNALCELSSELSMANDSVADDINCQALIRELICLFDKFYSLPDISMSALTCLNYILDLNPRYAATIIKWNGVSRIVGMTQNIEYIDCAENAIKAIEKMTFENPYAILENDAFQAVLVLIDFFDLNLRKSALKACVNMTKAINSMEYIKKFIIPAIPSLTNLTKYSGNSELEKSIIDLSVQCFFNIAYNVKMYNLALNNNNFCNSLIQYGLLENIFDLFVKFLGDEVQTQNQTQNQTKNYTASIQIDTFKNIIKLFEILSSLSADTTNLILNMNILEIVYSILNKELTSGSNNSSRKLSSTNSCYMEFFALLISFFPGKKSKQPDRLLAIENKHFFIYFSEKILTVLVNNVVNIPSSNSMVSLMRLLAMYIQNSPSEFIQKYIDPVKLSNIAGKMVDSKDSSYITEVFNIVEIVMSKVPESFFVPLLREGVVDNIKNLIEVEDGQLYYPQDSKTSSAGFYQKENLGLDDLFDEDEDDYEDLSHEGNPQQDNNAQNISQNTQTDNNIINTNINISNPSAINSFIKSQLSTFSNNPKNIYKKTSNPIAQNIQLKAKEITEKYFKEDYINELLKTNSSVNPKEILQKLNNIKEILKNSEKVDVSILTYLFDILFDKNKITFYEIEKTQIILYLTKFLDENYFSNYESTLESDKDIKTKTFISGMYNKKVTTNLKMLFSALNNDNDKIKDFLQMLQYCISSMNCFKLFLYDYGDIKNASHLFLSPFKAHLPKMRLKLVYSPSDLAKKQLLNDDKESAIFRETYEYFLNKKYVSLAFEQSETFEQVKEALAKYRNKIKEETSNTRESSDYYEEIFNQLRNRKGSEEDIQLTERILQRLIERKKSTEMEINNNANSNISHTPSQSQGNIEMEQQLMCNLDINFFVNINNSRMEIQNDWTISELFRQIRSFYKRSDYIYFSSDMQICFDIVYKENANENMQGLNLENNQASRSKLNASRKNSINPDYESELIIDVEDERNRSIIQEGYYEYLLFEKYYKDSIINNPSLYCIKRASPFFYLITLFELGINNFPSIFLSKASTPLVPSSLENMKMSSLLFKQVKDPYAVSSGNVPSWCKEISHSFPSLAAFNSRYLLFKISSFDTKRAMTNLFIYLKNYMGENILEDKTLNSYKRQKVKIDRNNLFTDTEKLMKDFRNFNGYLEFEYYDEVGTGIGPTYEFYSLISKEMRKLSDIWYKTSDFSLFPAPVDESNPSQVEENKRIFSILGFVIARGLFDDRLLDFPLNSLFWDLVLDRPISLDKISKVDKDLGKVFRDFTNIIAEKKIVLSKLRDESSRECNLNLNELIKYNNCKIEDIGLTFTLPGYNHIELKRNGMEELLTINNLEEYMALTFEKLILKGTKDYVEAFKSGFNTVFSISSLKCFTSQELEEIICGSLSESWDYDTLHENVLSTHGFDKNSFIFKALLEIMAGLDSVDRKKFLIFVTGSPRLPLGGFKNLSPKMTVVKKTYESRLENPNDYLPTVMTCQNYLKIPDYSDVKVLKEKLFLAMNEGGNAFHLS